MSNDHGWVSDVAGGDNSHLTDEQRELAEESIRHRHEAQGALLAIVGVHVYEHGAEPGVRLPEGAALGVETDPEVVVEVVARARAELQHWR